MKDYLIIVRKKEIYNSGKREELWLPATNEEIICALKDLGCDIVKGDYEVIYSQFGYAEIDNKVNRNSDILALNHIAKLLQSSYGTPNELCAELVYKECKNENDIIACLSNRSRLYVFEEFKDIAEYGAFCFKKDFWASDCCKRMTYKEYEDEAYYDETYPLWKRYYDAAMDELGGKNFRFTQYGLVYEKKTYSVSDEFEAPQSFGDIVVPF